MKPREALKEIFVNARELIKAHEEMGLDPPVLSKGALDFIRQPVARKPDMPPEKAIVSEKEGSVQAPDTSPAFHSLEALRAHVGDCRRCNLHEGRTNLVFGEGNEKARLVFVGEGPGFEEDKSGRPFVGKAGQLLTRIIENGMGLTRDAVYICNVVKCRPPGNRDPNPDEIETCLPFLKSQLAVIGPEVICAMGRVSCRALLGDDFRITRDRGHWRDYEGIPLMPTFHPAYLLRNPAAKRPVWDDVKSIMEKLGLKVKA